MYKIIGANRAEYGPVDVATIRQWIAEGRIDANTQAQMQGEPGWKPISSFPDFASSFPGARVAPAPPPQPPGLQPLGGFSPPPPGPQPFPSGVSNPYARQTALDKLNGPSIALIIASVIGILWSLKNLGFALFASQMMNSDVVLDALRKNPAVTPEMQQNFLAFMKIAMLVYPVISLLASAFVLFGAIKMRSLSNYGLCLAAAIVAVIPCVLPCCGLLSLPFGIWALVVLNSLDVKSQFT